MSYCRFGQDSDVYVYHSVYGHIECCQCSLPQAAFKLYLKQTPIRIKRPIWGGSLIYDTPDFLRQLNLKSLHEWRKVRIVQRDGSKRGPAVFTPKEKHVLRLINKVSEFKRRSAAISHLERHMANGDKVPNYALDRLREEIKNNGDVV